MLSLTYDYCINWFILFLVSLSLTAVGLEYHCGETVISLYWDSSITTVVLVYQCANLHKNVVIPERIARIVKAAFLHLSY